MEECPIRDNCEPYIKEADVCWHCTNYSHYLAIDRRILSPAQIERKEQRKATKRETKNSDASKRGRRSKRKGYQGEAEIVKKLNTAGIRAERVPLSGALKSEKYAGDILLIDMDKRGESKRLKSGLKTIQKWLRQDANTSYVFFREDGDTDGWIVVMELGEFIDLARRVNND